MIAFSCDKCGKKYQLADSTAGKVGKCGRCGKAMVVPNFAVAVRPAPPPIPAPPPAPMPPAVPAQVPCNFCGEAIQAFAKKCKHCGEFLDGSAIRPQQPVQHYTTPSVTQQVHVHNDNSDRRSYRHREFSGLLAVLMSFFVPGLGQLYKGRFAAAVLWFFFVLLGYLLIIPGLILHLWCLCDAAFADAA